MQRGWLFHVVPLLVMLVIVRTAAVSIPLAPSKLKQEGYICFVTGECTSCTKEEMGEKYCQGTQKRQEVTCEKNMPDGKDGDLSGKTGDLSGKTETIDTYEPCMQTPADEMSAVLRFQAAMAILGGLAMYGVRHQKLKHQTIYERRRLQQARGARGGYIGL